VRAPAATTAREISSREVGVGARAVLGRELHVVHVSARQFHRGHGFFQHLLPRLFQLVLQVDIAGGDEGVDARPAGVLQRLRGALHVHGAGAAQRGHLRPGNSRLMASTASKSPSEAMGKPASRMSTPNSTSLRAIRIFSGTFMLQPGDCSPSRSVVSKM
jgi:hypothetical protein